MKLVDTHTHLYSPEFQNDIDLVIQRGLDNNVEKFFLPAVDSTSLQSMLQLEKRFPGKCISMIGLHPCSVKDNYKEELKLVEGLLTQRRFAAVGEIGLDFYWDKTFTEQQYTCFHTQIEWALQYNLPIVIHSRESMKESIDVVKQHQHGKLKGIFHCFSGTYEDAQQIVELGFYLGIGGVLTYKKSTLPEAIKNISMSHIVLETDSPYLSPVPFRGKRNESSYLVYVAEKLAEIKGISLEEVAAVTTANAEKIFGS